MGICESVEQNKNKMIEKELRSDFQAEKKIVKLLLLGAAEGGKSTVLKQIKLIHDKGWSEVERMATRMAIYGNVVAAIETLLKGMKQLELRYHESCLEQYAENLILIIGDMPESKLSFDPEMIHRLWMDKNVQEGFMPQANQTEFRDNYPYFLNSIYRICQADYMPTIQDILRLRIMTTGIIQMKFLIRRVNFRIYDVGGQRSERKKWIHCFDNVNAIVYVAALSEFDQVICEDKKTNRMLESMRLFHTICNSRWFYKCAMILFLNKKDLFAEKIKHSSIKELFKNYRGSDSYEDQVKYISNKYGEMNLHPNKHIYMHETCATDTNQIQMVFDSVVDLLLRQTLNNYGIY